MINLKCIYCLSVEPLSGFNTEHVMPRAFGTFEHNFTLNNSVCRTCDTYFSQNLELRLARDSLEALDRIPSDSVSPESLTKLPFTETRLKITEGFYLGLNVRVVLNGEIPTVVPFPQVGFLREGETQWAYVTQGELDNLSTPLPTDIADDGIRIITPSEETEEQIIAILDERGVPFQRRGELASPGTDESDIEVEISGQVDQIIMRCVSKILFNYLSFCAGHEFTHDENFNVIRRFIRYGHVPDYRLVDVSNEPILHTDTENLRQTDGHLVTINWTGDNRHIIGQISLFNRITYRVSLASGFQGVWRPIRQGHLFDVGNRTISGLGVTSLILPNP